MSKTVVKEYDSELYHGIVRSGHTTPAAFVLKLGSQAWILILIVLIFVTAEYSAVIKVAVITTVFTPLADALASTVNY